MKFRFLLLNGALSWTLFLVLGEIQVDDDENAFESKYVY